MSTMRAHSADPLAQLAKGMAFLPILPGLLLGGVIGKDRLHALVVC